MLPKMPRACVDSAVADYRKRATSISQATHTIIPRFLTRRDHISNHKLVAAKHFVDFCDAKFGPLTPGTWEQFRAGKSLPAGWFIAYKNAHPQLTNACGTTNRASPDHQRILRLYKQAVKLYVAEKQRSALAQHFQEAHRGDGGGRCDVLAAVDNPNAKHTNKTSRSGCALWKTQLKFKRRTERRRGVGAGRPKSAIVVREALIDWYGVIRHSVDVKFMVRFPKQALLVKAQLLQADYLTSCLKHLCPPNMSLSSSIMTIL